MTHEVDTKVRHITATNGNIFSDLGFSPEEASQLLAASREEMARADELKKQLMVEITDWMKHNGLKQVDAAKILHVSRPRVSDVVNQKTEKFTIDTLVGMAMLIGKRVQLVIEKV